MSLSACVLVWIRLQYGQIPPSVISQRSPKLLQITFFASLDVPHTSMASFVPDTSTEQHCLHMCQLVGNEWPDGFPCGLLSAASAWGWIQVACVEAGFASSQPGLSL